MKSFTQFITEGRDAPIYHATDLDSYREMMAQNLIKPSRPDGFGKQIVWGVSTTRNLRFAKHYMASTKGYSEAVILQLDQRKIAQRYKIIPYNWDAYSSMDSKGRSFGLARHTSVRGSDVDFSFSHFGHTEEDEEDDMSPPQHDVASEYEELIITKPSGLILSDYLVKVIPIGVNAARVAKWTPTDMRHLIDGIYSK